MLHEAEWLNTKKTFHVREPQKDASIHASGFQKSPDNPQTSARKLLHCARFEHGMFLSICLNMLSNIEYESGTLWFKQQQNTKKENGKSLAVG